MATKLGHGSSLLLEELQAALMQRTTLGLMASDGVDPPEMFDYGFLFLELAADPHSTLLPGNGLTAAEIITALKQLGQAMIEAVPPAEETELPAAYTYFGQFVDHDITLEAQSSILQPISDLSFAPLTLDDIHNQLKNARTSAFDLDSVYGAEVTRIQGVTVPEDGEKLLLGFNHPIDRIPPGKTLDNDLPRAPKDNPDPGLRPKQALIGDFRNDENLIISQLHIAFLKLHNAFVEQQGLNFAEARQAVRQHYQAVVLFDFLKRICDPSIVDRTLQGNRFFTTQMPFMPLEFSVAAYRFGHSMVRPAYNYNLNFMPADMADIFSFTEVSGNIGPANEPQKHFATLPQSWIIEWHNFLELSNATQPQCTRAIDTALTAPLTHLREPGGVAPEKPVMAHLAKRNLLRGYLLRLPLGQSVARKITEKENVLSAETIQNNVSESERKALQNPVFNRGTPLWYYVLAEAKILGKGKRLGPVGSTIVAETIIGLMQHNKASILHDAAWQPSLGKDFPLTRKELEFRHLIQFAGLG